MKYLYYILFFILPFVVLPITSELFEFNKMLFIYAITSCIAGVWLAKSLQENKFTITKTPLDIPLGVFFVSQLVSTIFSIDRHTSFFGYYGRFNGGLLSTFVYLFLYYAFVSTIYTNRTTIIRTIFGISTISSILVVLWGLPGTFNHDLSCLLFTSKFDNSCWTAQFRPAERMFSTLGQPNWLGAYLAITFFTALYLFFTSTSKKHLFLSGIGVVVSFLGILLSRSRSSMMAILPGFILFAFYFMYLLLKKQSPLTQLQKRFTYGVLGALLLIVLVARTGIPQVDSILSLSFLTTQKSTVQPAPQKSLAVVGPITESLDIRKIVWAGAWELGRQYPLFGTGVETFGYAYYSVRPIGHNATSEWDYLYNKAHNEFLNLLATTGWFGLGSYLFLFACITVLLLKKMMIHRNNPDSLFFYTALAGIFISICITNFFGFSITIINVYQFLCIAFLVLYNESDIPQQTHLSKISLAQTGISLILVLWLLNSIITYWMADYTYAQSEIAIKTNNTAASVQLLQKALALRNEHVYEDKLSYALSQYAYLLLSEKNSKSEIQQIMTLSEKLNLKSIEASPQNVLYWKTRVKNQFIYYQMSLDKKYLFTGLSALDEAIKLAPTDPKIPYFSATYYSLLSDDEKNATQKALYQNKSLSAIDKTIALKMDYGDAYYLKVQLLRKYGKKAEAKKLLEWYIPRFAPGNETIQKELEEL